MAKYAPIRLGIVGLGRAGWSMHCGELKGKEFEVWLEAPELPDPIFTTVRF